MDNKTANSNSTVATDAGVGLTSGAAIGGVFGAAFGNYGIGIVVGALLGIVFGPAIGLAVRQSSEPPSE
jgi:hypothetical protein